MTLLEKLDMLKAERGINNNTLARQSGIPYTTIDGLYKKGYSSMKMTTLNALASFFGVSVDFLARDEVTDRNDALPLPSNMWPVSLRMVPVLGDIAAGAGLVMNQEYDEQLAIPDDQQADFVLRCAGDSMQPTVNRGDMVLIRSTPDVDDGQIAAVEIDDEATLKRVYHTPGGVTLVSDNPAFPPRTVSSVSCLRIIGHAVGVYRQLP